MDAEQLRQYGLRYRRYLSWLVPLGRYCPQWLWPMVQKTLGRALSPYISQEQSIRSGLAEVVGVEHSAAAWEAWLDSHSCFVRDFSRYHLLTPQMAQQHIPIVDTEVLDRLRAEGGLLLTYHTHHQNTLCCALGLAGCKVYPIAGAPETSPVFPYVSKWALQINRESARHFQGGEYLFINDMRHVARSVKKALAEKNVVVCLSDFHQPNGNGMTFPLFSHQISPPTGVIDLAVRLRAPVYIGLCAPEGNHLQVRLHDLGIADNVEDTVSAYIAHLQQACQNNPVCWQGWDWFNDLPQKA